MHKLDPIERLPDGSLFRLTPGQLRSVRDLTERCCNFLDGDCLLLDGVCPQYISRSGRTKYCPACAKEVHRQQKAKSARKRRSGVDNSGSKSR